MTALAIGAPQIIWIVLVAINLGIAFALNGQPSLPRSGLGAAIGAALMGGLLYWGGFFTA